METRISRSISDPECLPDGDGDGVPDDLDAFPEDQQGIKDSDSDGGA